MAARIGTMYVVGPNLAKWDQIWQPHSVLGPNLAAISCPVGLNVAARFGRIWLRDLVPVTNFG